MDTSLFGVRAETLHREIDTMLRVATHNNPNIVSLYDAFLTKDVVTLPYPEPILIREVIR